MRGVVFGREGCVDDAVHRIIGGCDGFAVVGVVLWRIVLFGVFGCLVNVFCGFELV